MNSSSNNRKNIAITYSIRNLCIYSTIDGRLIQSTEKDPKIKVYTNTPLV